MLSLKPFAVTISVAFATMPAAAFVQFRARRDQVRSRNNKADQLDKTAELANLRRSKRAKSRECWAS
jgi:hypothetical protein